MARILYTACGVGFGHGSRSTIVIKELKKKHEVKIVSYDAGHTFLERNFPDVIEMKWFKLFFAANKVDKPLTFIYNLFYLPFVAINNFLLFRNLIKEFKPDVIISDFDVNSLYAGKIFGIPVVLVTNMHMLRHWKTKLNWWDSLVCKLTDEIMLDFFINPTHTLIISIYKPDKKAKNVDFFGPMVDEEILKLDTKYEDIVVVYMSTMNFKVFKPILKQIPEIKFKVYGQNYEQVEGNVEVKEFSREKWLKDMARCSALICHGGMLTLSEAVILKKPCYVFATQNWFERYHNGKMIEMLGFGMMEDNATVKGVRKFLANRKTYQKNLAEKGPPISNKEVISRIGKLVEEITKK